MCLVLCVPGRGAAQRTDDEGAETPDEAPESSEPAPESADAVALSHFREARRLYDEGAYREALVQFRASYALSRRAVLFYNYSLCYQRLREYGDAVNFLERYLLEVVNIPDRANLELRLRGLRDAAAEAEESEETEDEGGGVRPAAWAFVGVAAAGALTTAVAGPLALSERSRLNEEPCAATSTCDASALRRRARIADAGLIIGSVGAVVGVILLIALRRKGDQAETVRIDPVFAIDGDDAHGGAQLVGHF